MTDRVPRPSPQVDRTVPPPAGELRPFRFPPFERRTLGNGLRIFAARLPGFPLVSLELLTPAGGIYDPPGKAGLASLTAGLIDEGTAGRSSLDIALTVERLGGYLATGIDWDGAYLAAGALTAHWRATLDLLAEVALSPSFPEPEIERLRPQRLAEILRRRQIPAALADQCLQRVLYAGTPYAWPLIGTETTVPELDRAAITGCYESLYRLSDSTLIVVGDLDPEALLPRAEELLGGSPSASGISSGVGGVGGSALPAPPEVSPRPLPELTVYLVDRPGSAQTEIHLGHAGVSRTHPDYPQLSVLNSILGGKFTSRINLNLRERHGYTYGATSRFNGRKGPGPFTINTSVATPSAGAATREILYELRRIREEEVAERELDEARSYVVGVFPYTLQTIGDLAKRLETLALYELPDDYFTRYLQEVRAVSRQEILAAAQRFLHPERSAIVAVGPAEELAPQLEGIGRIVRWDERAPADEPAAS